MRTRARLVPRQAQIDIEAPTLSNTHVPLGLRYLMTQLEQQARDTHEKSDLLSQSLHSNATTLQNIALQTQKLEQESTELAALSRVCMKQISQHLRRKPLATLSKLTPEKRASL